jgi:HK97 family phage prohead protease
VSRTTIPSWWIRGERPSRRCPCGLRFHSRTFSLCCPACEAESLGLRQRSTLATAPLPEPAVSVSTPTDSSDFLAVVRGRWANPGGWNEIHSAREARAYGFRGSRFMEHVAAGAFDSTLQTRGPRIRALWSHGRDAIPGTQAIGQLTQLGQGAEYELHLFDTAFNGDLLPQIRHGLVGTSYGFNVAKGTARKQARPSDHNPEGLPEVVLERANITEISLTALPADPNTTARLVE